MQKAPPTPKGFRDIKPDIAIKRRKVINTIVEVLEKHEFKPIETPTIEFAQTLTGKYGEEERLIYKFTDRGGRNLALRYDLTVPLARFIATYQHEIIFPFRRYQIGQVFRGENPQQGRYREFTQFDFDIVGSQNIQEDVEIIACALETVKSTGVKNPLMLINDRQNFKDFPLEVIRALDKLHKIGKQGIKEELKQKGLSQKQIADYLSKIETTQPTIDLKRMFSHLNGKYNLLENRDFAFDPTLARGLDYYTGPIFELKPSNDPKELSIGSGGRYDNLIGMFSKKQIPATGFSFGIDRLIELL